MPDVRLLLLRHGEVASHRGDVPVTEGDPVPFARRAWFRPTAPVPADPLLHLQVLAYMSDHGPTRSGIGGSAW